MKNSVLTNPVVVSGVVLYGLLMLTAVLLVIGLVRLRRRAKENVRSEFKQMLLKQRRFRAWTLLAAMGFMLAFTLAFWVRSGKTVSAIISLNYTEASSGQNANGTRYNMGEIISLEVLERAIEKGALEDVTASQLASCLTVEPLVQGNSYNEDGYHIATEFLVTYEADSHTAHLNAENVIVLVANAYKEFYIDQYADDFSVLDLDLDQSKLESLDYLDIVTYLEQQAYKVEKYMYSLMNENSSFISSSGDTFSSLASKVQTLSKVQIQEGLESYILHNGVSKDPDGYVGRLEYEDKLLDYDMQRATASFEVRNEAIAMYDEEMTRVVLVPTWDNEGKYYMGRTKVGIDDLSVQAEEYSQQAASYLKDIEKNRTVISSMDGSTHIGTDETAEQMIAGICQTLDGYAKAAKAAGQEYSETQMNRCMSTTLDKSSFVVKAVICLLGAFVFYGVLNLFAVSNGLGKRKGSELPRIPEQQPEGKDEAFMTASV